MHTIERDRLVDVTPGQALKIARLHESGYLDATLDYGLIQLDFADKCAEAACSILRAQVGVSSEERAQLLTSGVPE